METNAEKIMTEALSLSPQERAFVAEKLIESLDAAPGEDLSQAWQIEIRKRCSEMEEGLVELRSIEEVFANARSALK